MTTIVGIDQLKKGDKIVGVLNIFQKYSPFFSSAYFKNNEFQNYWGIKFDTENYLPKIISITQKEALFSDISHINPQLFSIIEVEFYTKEKKARVKFEYCHMHKVKFKILTNPKKELEFHKIPKTLEVFTADLKIGDVLLANRANGAFPFTTVFTKLIAKNKSIFNKKNSKKLDQHIVSYKPKEYKISNIEHIPASNFVKRVDPKTIITLKGKKTYKLTVGKVYQFKIIRYGKPAVKL